MKLVEIVEQHIEDEFKQKLYEFFKLDNDQARDLLAFLTEDMASNPGNPLQKAIVGYNELKQTVVNEVRGIKITQQDLDQLKKDVTAQDVKVYDVTNDVNTTSIRIQKWLKEISNNFLIFLFFNNEGKKKVNNQ